MKYLVTVVLSIFTLLVNAQSKEDLYKEILKNHLDSLYEEDTDFGGLTVGVSFGDNKTIGASVGLADIEQKIKMPENALMPGGSTGKIYFSSLAMILVNENKLGLDKKVSEYIGDREWYPRIQNADKITIRNLLQHSTGISRYVFDEKFQKELAKDADRKWLPEELLSYVLDLDPLFEAGSDFSYSDTNYIILAIVLEEITGKDLYKLIDKKILKPNKLKLTVPQTKRTIMGIVPGYNSDTTTFYPGKVVENNTYKYNYQFEYAGGGYLTNTKDLAKMGKLMYEGKIFDDSIFPEYFKGIDAKELRGTWGLGVHIRESPMGLIYGHSGFFPGYITNMVYFKDYKISIAVQINTSDYPKLMLYGKFMRSLNNLVEKLDKI